MSTSLTLKTIKTPIGDMLAGATDKGICLFDFSQRRMMTSIMNRIITMLDAETCEGEHPHFKALETQVEAYFNGTLTVFDLPLQLLGTPFQVSVWQGLQKIEYGYTRSYKAQSIFLGNEKAIRAVARANGENGIAIIVPCHRVIGENGDLTGYGGGLWRKKWLLEHETKHSGRSNQLALFS